jgi:hypothetical protein
MSIIDDLLTSVHVSGKIVHFQYDLEAAFYQIGLKKESRKLTTFVTQDSLCEFNILPIMMGLGNSPAVMQRLKDIMLRGMEKFARGYFNDIINILESL